MKHTIDLVKNGTQTTDLIRAGTKIGTIHYSNSGSDYYIELDDSHMATVVDAEIAEIKQLIADYGKGLLGGELEVILDEKIIKKTNAIDSRVDGLEVFGMGDKPNSKLWGVIGVQDGHFGYWNRDNVKPVDIENVIPLESGAYTSTNGKFVGKVTEKTLEIAELKLEIPEEANVIFKNKTSGPNTPNLEKDTIQERYGIVSFDKMYIYSPPLTQAESEVEEMKDIYISKNRDGVPGAGIKPDVGKYPIMDGLVHWYDYRTGNNAERTRMFRDLSGQGNHSSLNSVTLFDDTHGWGADGFWFNETYANSRIPPHTHTDSISVSIYMKEISSTDLKYIFCSNATSGRFTLQTRSNFRLRYAIGDVSSNGATFTDITPRPDWKHVTMVWNATTSICSIYHDGILSESVSRSNFNASLPVRLNAYHDSSSDGPKFVMKNYMSYSRVLTPEEILYNFNNINDFTIPNEPKREYYKTSLHSHTTNSDGAQSPIRSLQDHYVADFRVMAISDHDFITPDKIAELVSFDSCEETSKTGNHIQAIGITTQAPNGLTAQEIVDYHKVNNPNAVIMYNHPKRSGNVFTDDQLKFDNGYHLIEIENLNSGRNDEASWDIALTAGKKVWGVCNDDCHNTSSSTSFNGAWSMLKMKNYTQTEARRCLLEGDFYATRGGHEIYVTQSGNIITARSQELSTFTFITENGVIAKTVSNVLTADFETTGLNKKYVRVKSVSTVRGSMRAYSQPIFFN